MTQEQLKKLEQARDLVFEVEQEWRKEAKIQIDRGDITNGYYGADTLYSVRVELNNAMSRW